MAAPPSIAEGSVTYDSQPAEAVREDPDAGSGVWGDFMIHNHYERDGVSYACSNTSPEPFGGADVSVVTLGNAVLYWVCEWTACKVGTMPEVPDPDAQGSGWTLLDQHASAAMQSLGPSGSDGVFRISGVYVYVRSRAKASVLLDVSYPIAPWVRDGAFPRTVPLSTIKRGLSDAPGGSAPTPPFAGTSGSDIGAAGKENIAPQGFVNQG